MSPPPHHHKTTTTRLMAPLIAAATTLSLLLLLFIFLYRRLSHLLYNRPKTTSTTTTTTTTTAPRRFSFSTLRRATSNFSTTRRLGQGGFGSVFSGTLTKTLTPKSTVPIAVKLMDSGSLQGEREFHNEIFLAHKMIDSAHVVKLLGFASSRKRRRMCLVYELMSNGNLQDCLILKKCDIVMDWCNRFRIMVDIAKGLAFLHHQCDPPIIHGDVKASNILLDENFRARIGDFGLARLKLSDLSCNSNDVVVDIDGIKGNCDVDNGNGNVGVLGVEDSGSVMETESVTTTVGFEEGSVGIDQSPIRIETSPEMVTAVASPADFLDKGSDLEANGIGNGKGKVGVVVEGEKGEVKDYVMEWIETEVDKERPLSSYLGGGGGEASASSKPVDKVEKKKGKKKLGWWMSTDGVMSKKEKRRPAREWWKEEYSQELAKKRKKKKKQQGTMTDNDEHFWPRDDEMYVDKKNKKSNKFRSRSGRSNIDWWLDGFSGDLRKGHHTGYDSMSGEIPKSGGISSTPSMRGTVCYIAPEYSAGGDLSEKCDVYSFGVLLLVIIAGRRPLQVTGSPMSEFHRANLISWARQLARSGKLLDLVDKNVRSLDQEQAQLCITVALICLQKSPSRRPSMKEVVGMLTSELDPPKLPLEYTSYPYKSRKKLR